VNCGNIDEKDYSMFSEVPYILDVHINILLLLSSS